MKTAVLCLISLLSFPCWSQISGGGVTTPRDKEESSILEILNSWSQLKGGETTVQEDDGLNIDLKEHKDLNWFDIQSDNQSGKSFLIDPGFIINEAEYSKHLRLEPWQINNMFEFNPELEKSMSLDEMRNSILKGRNFLTDEQNETVLHHHRVVTDWNNFLKKHTDTLDDTESIFSLFLESRQEMDKEDVDELTDVWQFKNEYFHINKKGTQ